MHGHNWKVEAEIASDQLNNLAMVSDFKEIKKKMKKALKGLDHSHLNELPYFRKNNPTSEKIAEFIYCNLKKLIKSKNLILKSISVWETDSSCATFSEDGYV